MRKSGIAEGRVGAVAAAAGLLALVIATAALGVSGAAAAPPAAGPAPTRPVAARTVVPVSETEFRIWLPRTSFRAGVYTFAVRNIGRAPHSLRIVGAGVNRATRVLGPGQSANLTVLLRPGRYLLDCPVDNHAARGMRLGIFVR
jgi:hypothetical protein